MAGPDAVGVSSPPTPYPVVPPSSRSTLARAWLSTTLCAVVILLLAGTTALLLIGAATAVLWAWEQQRAEGVVVSSRWPAPRTPDTATTRAARHWAVRDPPNRAVIPAASTTVAPTASAGRMRMASGLSPRSPTAAADRSGVIGGWST